MLALGIYCHRAHRQRTAVYTILRAGGQVTHTHEFRSAHRPTKDQPSPVFRWLVNLFGIDFVDRIGGVVLPQSSDEAALSVIPYLYGVREISLRGVEMGDKEIGLITCHHQLEVIDLSATEITDKSLAPLLRLQKLRRLNLTATAITGKGLQQIGMCKNLEIVTCYSTSVNEGQVNRLREANPEIHIDWTHARSKRHVNGAAMIIRLGGVVQGITNDPQKYPHSQTHLAILPPIWKGGNDGLAHAVDMDDVTGLAFRPLTAGRDSFRITERGWASIARLKKLESLLLSVAFNEDDLKILKELPQLECLAFRHNMSVSNESLKYLSELKNLRILDLTSTNITGSGLSHLKHLQNLEELLLWETNIGDKDLVHLSGLTKLDTLALAETHLTDKGLMHLKKLPQLRSLWLQSTAVSDAGLLVLKDLPALETILVENTNVSAQIDEKMGERIEVIR